MADQITSPLWSQFGASIDMLENAIQACPPEHWDTESKFWYNAYHTIFFLDYYLTMEPAEFFPPRPFTESEFGEDKPERTYSREELLNYLQHCRKKCRVLLINLTDEKLQSRWINVSGSMNYSVFEILLYNMRHVQHHAAQLNLLLRQAMNEAPHWVSRTQTKLASPL